MSAKKDPRRIQYLSEAAGEYRHLSVNDDILSHLQNDIFGLDVDINELEGGVSRYEANSIAETVLKIENVKLAPRMKIGSRKVGQRYAESLR